MRVKQAPSGAFFVARTKITDHKTPQAQERREETDEKRE